MKKKHGGVSVMPERIFAPSGPGQLVFFTVARTVDFSDYNSKENGKGEYEVSKKKEISKTG